MIFKKRQRRPYPLERSPLWQLRSQKEFADLLGLKKSKLRRLVTEREFHYRAWTEVIDGKERHISVPVGPIRRIHERLQGLLERIQKPDYLYSPRIGYSPTKNAALHLGAEEVFKVDIKRFYPSTTREHVFRFCLHHLNMSDDVAGMFCKLATFEGKAPFGSPLSPILCALVHKDMFDAIDQRCRQESNRMSVWVDDITISGDRVDRNLTQDVREAIRRKGLAYHKQQRRHVVRGAIITGAFVSKAGIAPANKSHLKVRSRLADFDRTPDPRERLRIVQSLLGMTNQALLVYPNGSPGYIRAGKRRQWLHNQRRLLEAIIDEKYSTTGPGILPISEHSTAPWQ